MRVTSNFHQYCELRHKVWNVMDENERDEIFDQMDAVWNALNRYEKRLINDALIVNANDILKDML